MERVFLDANYFIDLVERKKNLNLKQLSANSLFISPLSIHILVYVYKYKIPNLNLSKINENLNIVPLDRVITNNSLMGPTNDFEDNIQLNSAASSNCNLFLTRDKKILKLRFFGKVKIQLNLV